VGAEKKLNFKINIGLGRSYPLEKLPLSYQEAVTSLKYASFRRTREVVHISQFRSLEEKTIYPAEIDFEFFNSLTKEDPAEREKAAEKIFREIKKIPLAQGKSWVIKILSDLYHRIVRNSQGERAFFLKRHLETLGGILKAENYRELKEIIEQSLVDYQRMRRELGKGRKEDLVERVKEYINHNYQRDLRRREVAAALNVSESTLVKTLRKDGLSFIEILTQRRLDRAKELLQNTSLRPTQVGFRVGYQNIYTFYHAFKSIYQMSPGEYRKSISS
jgi:two-component system response regulator YesN